MRRNCGLDLLRLLAVILVIGRHLLMPEDSQAALVIWRRGGWVGVDLFFVLSGFLVAGLLFHEHINRGTVDVRRFLIRRALKIYPAFWILMLVTCIVTPLIGEYLDWRHLLAELLFIQNYRAGLWWHTWSLAVEEHFYVSLAMLTTWLATHRPGKRFDSIPAITLAVALTCLALRILTALVNPIFSFRWYVFTTHIRIDSLMFGVLLSYLFHYRDLMQRIRVVPTAVLLTVGASLLAPAFVFASESYRFITVFGFVLFYLGSGCLVLAAVRFETSDRLLVRSLSAVGRASYSIYLWHMAVNFWLAKRFLETSLMWYLVVYAVGSLVAGLAMNKLVEWPLLKWRDRRFPSQAALQTHAPSPPALLGDAARSPGFSTAGPPAADHARVAASHSRLGQSKAA